MSRIQLALNVSDVDAAVDFYSRLFGAPPAKRRPGYANFAVDEPALKLVLIENPVAAGTVNHLGVEVEGAQAVSRTRARLLSEGLAATPEEDVACCYARQDKTWLDDPDGVAWEVYAVLGDADVAPASATAACCSEPAATQTEAAEAAGAAACGCL